MWYLFQYWKFLDSVLCIYVYRSTVIVLGSAGANVILGDTQKLFADWDAVSNTDSIYNLILHSLWLNYIWMFLYCIYVLNLCF